MGWAAALCPQVHSPSCLPSKRCLLMYLGWHLSSCCSIMATCAATCPALPSNLPTKTRSHPHRCPVCCSDLLAAEEGRVVRHELVDRRSGQTDARAGEAAVAQVCCAHGDDVIEQLDGQPTCERGKWRGKGKGAAR